MRVHITPTFDTPDQADGGLRRVVDAQRRWLPEFGVEVVRDPREADILHTHGASPPPRDDLPLVVSCHGLMWSDYDWRGAWAEAVNRSVIDAMSRADAVTAPSHWVARAIGRGMLIRPEVVYHGIDADDWTPAPSRGYVLWNKARTDPVSDPRPVNRVAARLPDVPFVTTFGEPAANVQVVGAVPYGQMRPMVQHAGVYLATARETFGIGTLEALAAGVPVVGYAIGGQREIIRDGETGYLVPEGDDAALAEAITRALAERERLGANARADAIARWGWRFRIGQYADLYRRVLAEHTAPRPRVSVVITTYNLNQYLPEAIASAAGADELIVVDDCGSEDARDIYPQAVRTPENLGLSGARNFGAQHATGRYLLFLDADDALPPGALQTLADALDRDPALHIAAGGLQVMGQDAPNPWPRGVDWAQQIAHLNTLHYAAMWRRDAFLRTGGYRVRDWRAEDAAHWVRALSFGLRAAQVTAAPTLLYRIRPDSKSQQEAQAHPDRDGDWTAWFPWRRGARSGPEGSEIVRRGTPPPARLVPFGAPAPAPRRSWPVWHHEHPLVSVVIPVGPGHTPYLVDALDSLIAQAFRQWEAIVVNDSGEALDLPGHPWVRVIDYGTGPEGAGLARNRGLFEARAPLVLFLDADDVLRPEALARLVRAYAAGGASYVYSDTLMLRAGRLADVATQDWRGLPVNDPQAPATVWTAPEYDQATFLASGYTEGRTSGHSVTALIETEAARAVGGFPEDLAALEDWAFYLSLAAGGYCGRRVPEPLLVYRLTTGERRQIGAKRRRDLMMTLKARYAPYAEGTMPKKSCCGGQATVAQTAQDVLKDAPAETAALSAPPAGYVRMRYVGAMRGAHTVIGRPSGMAYRMGNSPEHRHYNAKAEDVAYLASLEGHEVVR